MRSFDKAKTIYEIKSVVNEPYFTVRQKHTLSIINLNLDNLKVRKIRSDIPLVSSDVDPSMNLILVDAKQNLQLYSLIDEKPLSKVKIFENEMTIDNWTSVRFIEQNRFICANRHNVSVYDVRQPIGKPVICHNFISTMGVCEDITCMGQSRNSYNTFIATTHKLLALDTRNYKDGQMPTFTWTHQLKTAPIFMDIKKIDNTRELVAIAGMKCGDIRICDTEMIENATISKHLPYSPFTFHEAFKYAKNGGNFLDPSSLILHQIRQSNTGIHLKQINSNKFSLLTKNLCGDIFAQDILHKQEYACYDIPEPNISRLTIWDDDLRKNRNREKKPCMEISAVTNFETFASFLSSNMHKKVEESVIASAENQSQPWQKSIEELSTYQDVLANSLLDKWVIADDDEMDVKYTDDRMNDWVEATVEQYHVFQEDICVKSEEEIQEYDIK